MGGGTDAYLTATLNGGGSSIWFADGEDAQLVPETNTYTGTYEDWIDVLNNHDAYEIKLVGNCEPSVSAEAYWSDQYNAWLGESPLDGFSLNVQQGVWVTLTIGASECPSTRVIVTKK